LIYSEDKNEASIVGVESVNFSWITFGVEIGDFEIIMSWEIFFETSKNIIEVVDVDTVISEMVLVHLFNICVD